MTPVRDMLFEQVRAGGLEVRQKGAVVTDLGTIKGPVRIAFPGEPAPLEQQESG